MSFHDQNNPAADTPLDQTGESSLTQQNFKDECDINSIMEKYNTTGFIEPGAVSQRDFAFGNFAESADFNWMQDAVHQAEMAFMTMPASERRRHGNDLTTFMEWLTNPANESEAVSLGLISGPLGPHTGVTTGLDKFAKPFRAGAELREDSKALPTLADGTVPPLPKADGL